MFVHQVINKGTKDPSAGNYTKLLLERKRIDRILRPPFPFQITSDFTNAFQAALRSDTFSDFKEADDWATPTDQGRVSVLLTEVERLMKHTDA